MDTIKALKMENSTENNGTMAQVTNFFTAIAALGVEGNLNLTIRVLKDGSMVVSTRLTNALVGDKAKNQILPLNITGTPQELDDEYFGQITQPMIKASGLISNMEAYLKSLEVARTKSRMEEDKKKSESKDKQKAVEAATENVQEYKAEMEKCVELEKVMKYDEALKALPDESAYPKRKDEIEKKRKELQAKAKLATLF